MREPKNQMLGTMVPPLMQLSVNRVLLKVARLAKSVILIPFIMGYVVGLILQNLELKISFQSDIRLLRY